MIELALLVVIVAVVVLALRRGAASGEPVIVHRPGQYHITLAPQLVSSQGFVETLAQRLAGGPRPEGDVPTRYYRMGREGSQAESSGLLAIAFRKGVYFIQAIAPHPLQRDTASHLVALREFSEAVLIHYPPVPPLDEGGAGRIDAAVEEVARQAGVTVGELVA